MESTSAKISIDQIKDMLKRHFGSGLHSFSVEELGGGTFNETYLIEISEKEKVVLKIAPPVTLDMYWDDVALMRREHNILPFFASISPLTPKTIFVDFTHQLIGRDYVLQTFIEGDRWSDIEDKLTKEESIDLWRQCGEIVKQIHSTTGEQFGYPYPGKSFTNWSDVILDRFSQIAWSLQGYHIEISQFFTIFDIVNSAKSVLDNIRTPRLLHGDLWTFNLLVTRKSEKPFITGVLDTERAWWGDPLADWMMFLLSIRSEEKYWQPQLAAFYSGYGALRESETTQFRQELYKAMHIGASAVWAARHGNQEDLQRATRDLSRIATLLPELLG